MLSAGCDKLGLGSDASPTAPSGPPAAGASIHYTAVGASDVNGIGSSVPCLPYTACSDGRGYVPVAVRGLKAQGYSVTLTLLGIPTAVIGRDFETLGQQYDRTIVGNLIEQEMPFVLPDTTLVTIFAGGNEVNTITSALGGGAGGSDPNAYIDAEVKAFATDFTTLLDGIRSRAPTARILVLNVPNMAGLPYLAGASLEQRRAAQRAAVAITKTVVNPLAAQNIPVVDLMCDPQTYVSSSYSPDGLHPNDAGYASIAGKVVSAATTSGYPPPQEGCASMTMVP